MKQSTATSKAIKISFLWLVAEAIIWVPYRSLISYDRTLIAILYFSFFSFITVLLFKDIFQNLISNTKITKFSLLIGSLLIHGGVYWFCNNHLTAPNELIENNPASYILVNNYFLLGKPFDILLQQVMIIVLVAKLIQEQISLRTITSIVVIIFGIAHLEALRRMELIYALILTCSTVLMSLFIPRLILKTQDGFLYSFMLHVGLVDIAALLAWTLF